MAHYLLTAAGPDRPGLVADVSKLLFGLGCNLEDSSMTRIQGEFAMLVIFSAPPAAKPLTPAKFKPLTKRGIRITLKPLTPKERRAPSSTGRTRIVAVYGPDKPGIVHRATEALAGRGFNITDLSTHRTEGETPGYILYIEGEAPEAVSDDELAKALREGVDPALTVTVKPVESGNF